MKPVILLESGVSRQAMKSGASDDSSESFFRIEDHLLYDDGCSSSSRTVARPAKRLKWSHAVQVEHVLGVGGGPCLQNGLGG